MVVCNVKNVYRCGFDRQQFDNFQNGFWTMLDFNKNIAQWSLNEIVFYFRIGVQQLNLIGCDVERVTFDSEVEVVTSNLPNDWYRLRLVNIPVYIDSIPSDMVSFEIINYSIGSTVLIRGQLGWDDIPNSLEHFELSGFNCSEIKFLFPFLFTSYRNHPLLSHKCVVFHFCGTTNLSLMEQIIDKNIFFFRKFSDSSCSVSLLAK